MKPTHIDYPEYLIVVQPYVMGTGVYEPSPAELATHMMKGCDITKEGSNKIHHRPTLVRVEKNGECLCAACGAYLGAASYHND